MRYAIIVTIVTLTLMTVVVWGSQRDLIRHSVTVNARDIQVHAYMDHGSGDMQLESGKLHVICDAKRGNVLYVYASTITVVKGACK